MNELEKLLIEEISLAEQERTEFEERIKGGAENFRLSNGAKLRKRFRFFIKQEISQCPFDNGAPRLHLQTMQ